MTYFAACGKCGAFFRNKGTYQVHIASCNGIRPSVKKVREDPKEPFNGSAADHGSNGSEPPQIDPPLILPTDDDSKDEGSLNVPPQLDPPLNVSPEGESKPYEEMTPQEKRKATLAAKKAAAEKEGEDE